MRAEAGFSFLELLVALTLLLIVSGTVFTVMSPSQDVFSSRVEIADMQQRLRVAADMLAQRLVVAGVGAYSGANAGPLTNVFAPVLPYRAGGGGADPPGSYKTDTITAFAVARNGSPPASVTFWLKSDEMAATYQLMLNESSNNLDIPVVDNLVALAFEYYGEPQPPTIREPADPSGPWSTTYGPAPSTTAVPPFAAGENCLFVANGPSPPQARLADLGTADAALVRLSAAQLTDGPWCPDDAAANRWDADLLRIRAVGIMLRVQSAISALRGPAGPLFAHAGTSRGGETWAPDQEVRFQVTFRNASFGR